MNSGWILTSVVLNYLALFEFATSRKNGRFEVSQPDANVRIAGP
jgi:hypothetical protein